MRVSDVLTLAGGAGKVVPAISSLTSASKKIQHGHLGDYQLAALLCVVLPFVLHRPAARLCCAGLLGALQTTSREPSGTIPRAERPTH